VPNSADNELRTTLREARKELARLIDDGADPEVIDEVRSQIRDDIAWIRPRQLGGYPISSLDDLREKGYEAAAESIEEHLDLITQVQENSMRDRIEPLLSLLTDKQREVIVLVCFGNMTDTEASGYLGISQQTVWQHKHAALKKLRAEIRRTMLPGDGEVPEQRRPSDAAVESAAS
jgi:RNA polymerase sigma factor (sigma-70 family)